MHILSFFQFNVTFFRDNSGKVWPFRKAPSAPYKDH